MTDTRVSNASHLERLKRAAAEAALDLVEPGMLLGLGTGSTAKYVTIGIAERLADGRLERVRGVPTSEATRALAASLGIPLEELPASGVDLAIDGMDEVDPDLGAIKGLGGALLREKIVAAAATRFVLVGDGSKPVTRLGERAPVPVEVLPFGSTWTLAALRALDIVPAVRTAADASPFLTDNGNPVVDCAFDPGRDARVLAQDLDAVPGVLGHGLFLGLARAAYIASEKGVRILAPAGRA